VEVQQVGNDGGGDPGGEMDHGGAASGPRVDPEVPQALPEVLGRQGPAGEQAREQPWCPDGGADAHVAPSALGETGDQAAERLGQGQAVAPEAELHLLATSYNLVRRYGDDTA
jgi:hypothetical protein